MTETVMLGVFVGSVVGFGVVFCWFVESFECLGFSCFFKVALQGYQSKIYHK